MFLREAARRAAALLYEGCTLCTYPPVRRAFILLLSLSPPFLPFFLYTRDAPDATFLSIQNLFYILAGEYHTDADRAASGETTRRLSRYSRAPTQRNPDVRASRASHEEKPRRETTTIHVGESDSESRFTGLKEVQKAK